MLEPWKKKKLLVANTGDAKYLLLLQIQVLQNISSVPYLFSSHIKHILCVLRMIFITFVEPMKDRTTFNLNWHIRWRGAKSIFMAKFLYPRAGVFVRRVCNGWVHKFCYWQSLTNLKKYFRARGGDKRILNTNTGEH